LKPALLENIFGVMDSKICFDRKLLIRSEYKINLVTRDENGKYSNYVEPILLAI